MLPLPHNPRRRGPKNQEVRQVHHENRDDWCQDTEPILTR